MYALALTPGSPILRAAGAAWRPSPDDLLDGVAPAAVISPASGRYVIGGAAVAPGDALAVSSGSKRVVGPTGAIETVAADAPALDWSSGRPRLVIEARAATNDLLHSGDLSASAWLKSAGLTLAATVAAPDGTLSARCFEGSAANVYQFAATPVGPQVHSIWVRRHVVPSVTVYLWEAGIGFVSTVGLDFTTGALTTQSGPGGATAVAHADGWWRVSVPWTSTAGSVALGVYSDAGFCAWGAQSEVGNAASSYVPTTSAVATRMSDDVRLSPAVTALVAAAGGCTIAMRGSVHGLDWVLGGATGGAILASPGSYRPGDYGEVVTPTGWDAAAWNAFGVVLGCAPTSRSGTCNGGTPVARSGVSSAWSLASETSLRLGAATWGEHASSRVFVDEMVIWPFVGSDAGLEAQARIWS